MLKIIGHVVSTAQSSKDQFHNLPARQDLECFALVVRLTRASVQRRFPRERHFKFLASLVANGVREPRPV